MNLSQLLDEFPPCLCRLLARKHGRPLTGEELSKLSNINRFRVNRISQMTSWDSTTVWEAAHFMLACNVDLLHAKRHREFIRRANWSHIAGSPYHLKLLTRLYNARNQTNPSP